MESPKIYHLVNVLLLVLVLESRIDYGCCLSTQYYYCCTVVVMLTGPSLAIAFNGAISH
jgi:hypothetical protein